MVEDWIKKFELEVEEERIPEYLAKEIKNILKKIQENIEKAKKKALIRKLEYPISGDRIDSTELDLPYGDKKYAEIFASPTGYGFDCMVTISELIHWFDDYGVEAEKREYVINFRVVTKNLKPEDLLIVAEAQVGPFEWIHQPLYITIAEFLRDKTNEMELLIGDELVIFHSPGLREAYNPFGGLPLNTPNFFALRIIKEREVGNDIHLDPLS